MKKPAHIVAVLVAFVFVVSPSCKELGDAIEGGEEGRDMKRRIKARNERKKGLTTAAKRSKGSGLSPGELAAMEKRKAEGDWATFPPNSPAGRLLGEIRGRIECQDSKCKEHRLKRITESGNQMLPGLPALLRDQPNEVILDALRIIGLVKYQPALEAVGELVITSDEEIRSEALWTIGELRDPRAVDFLARMVIMGFPKGLAKSACTALGKIGAAAGIETVGGLWELSDSRARISCANALGRIGTAEAVPLLVRAAKDRDQNINRAAIRALKSIEHSSAKKALRKLLAAGLNPGGIQ